MQDDKLFGPAELPELPPHARYVFHENRCFDWGTIGWAIQEGKVDTAQYRYTIFNELLCARALPAGLLPCEPPGPPGKLRPPVPCKGAQQHLHGGVLSRASADCMPPSTGGLSPVPLSE